MTKRSSDEAGPDDDPLSSDGSDYDSEESDDESGSDDDDESDLLSLFEPEECFHDGRPFIG